jgi:hypothetical protein
MNDSAIKVSRAMKMGCDQHHTFQYAIGLITGFGGSKLQPDW